MKVQTHTENYHVAKSYLDMARAVIDTELHRPRLGSTNDAEFGLVSCTYIYSYMAITAFVSGHLYTCWNRKDSDLKKNFPNTIILQISCSRNFERLRKL